jgi:hypothetical protein
MSYYTRDYKTAKQQNRREHIELLRALRAALSCYSTKCV